MNNPKQTQDVPSLERATGPAASRSGLRGKLLIDSRLIQEYKMSLVRNLLDLPEHIQAVLRGLPDGYAVKVSVKGNRGDYVELDSRSIVAEFITPNSRSGIGRETIVNCRDIDFWVTAHNNLCKLIADAGDVLKLLVEKKER